MDPVKGSAPGKIILFGEHAVVYGQPALAVPVTDVCTYVTITRNKAGSGLRFQAPVVGDAFSLASRPNSALTRMARLTLSHIRRPEPDAIATIESTIPVAAGLGSGAAVSAALGRALAQFYGQDISDSVLSALVFEIEKLHHGTPSGIDNTVICHAKPVYFIRESEPEVLPVAREFHLLIGDTGVASATKTTVADVRERRIKQPHRFDAIFASIGDIVRSARAAIEAGDISLLGPLMRDNQELLAEMGVSSPELDRLIDAAIAAGADGAKLSGGGGGGNMIAVAEPELVEDIRAALSTAGAVRTIHTVVHTTKA